MLGMNSPMNANQIMNLLNQNPLMKSITYSLIQYPLIINQMLSIINSLAYNPSLMNEIRNKMSQDLNMMNMNNMNLNNMNMNNMNNMNLNNMNMNNMNKMNLKNMNNMGFINMNNMMNPMMNPIMKNDFNFNQETKSEEITVYFDNREIDKRLPITCQTKEKVSELIERYRRTYNDNNKKIKFIYNAKILHPSLTCDEAGLMDNSIIIVINTEEMIGG